jgi:hypothetical protein
MFLISGHPSTVTRDEKIDQRIRYNQMATPDDMYMSQVRKLFKNALKPSSKYFILMKTGTLWTTGTNSFRYTTITSQNKLELTTE